MRPHCARHRSACPLDWQGNQRFPAKSRTRGCKPGTSFNMASVCFRSTALRLVATCTSTPCACKCRISVRCTATSAPITLRVFTNKTRGVDAGIASEGVLTTFLPEIEYIHDNTNLYVKQASWGIEQQNSSLSHYIARFVPKTIKIITLHQTCVELLRRGYNDYIRLCRESILALKINKSVG